MGPDIPKSHILTFPTVLLKTLSCVFSFKTFNSLQMWVEQVLLLLVEKQRHERTAQGHTGWRRMWTLYSASTSKCWARDLHIPKVGRHIPTTGFSSVHVWQSPKALRFDWESYVNYSKALSDKEMEFNSNSLNLWAEHSISGKLTSCDTNLTSLLPFTKCWRNRWSENLSNVLVSHCFISEEGGESEILLVSKI